MTSISIDPSFTRIRRIKKSISDEARISSFLRRAPVGVLATVFEDQPFLSTKLFVYEEDLHVIYLHSADEGRVMDNIRLNPKVCFTAYELGRFLPAPKARGFGVEYESVVIFGRLQVVVEAEEMIAALEKFMDKYASHLVPVEDYQPIQRDDLSDLAVYRLEILGWSAKEDRGDAEHPGAYQYQDLGEK